MTTCRHPARKKGRGRRWTKPASYRSAPDAEILRDIRELDDELEDWRLSIDARLRPKLSCRSGDTFVEPTANVSEAMHIIFSHFEYHFVMACIHRATGRCRAWSIQQSGEMEAVNSSLAISVEASRSTLVILRATIPSILGECFWSVLVHRTIFSASAN